MAVAQAEAGVHVVGPSGMMDGQVGVIREALDAAGHLDVAILAYAVKYASAFFGPFREAVASSLQGDRRTYQQDPANGREALRETALDLAEGADMVMVKPALGYLDVLREVAAMSDVPVAAYNVSGEYSMVEAAAAAGYIDRERAILETLTSIRRAGADIVLTYWADRGRRSPALARRLLRRRADRRAGHRPPPPPPPLPVPPLPPEAAEQVRQRQVEDVEQAADQVVDRGHAAVEVGVRRTGCSRAAGRGDVGCGERRGALVGGDRRPGRRCP